MSATIRPLATSQKVLTWLCVYPADKNTSFLKRCAYVALYFYVLIGNMSVLISSIVFFVTYVSTDFELSLYAVFQMAAYTSSTYLMLLAYTLRNQITSVFDGLARIYEASECIIVVQSFADGKCRFPVQMRPKKIAERIFVNKNPFN